MSEVNRIPLNALIHRAVQKENSLCTHIPPAFFDALSHSLGDSAVDTTEATIARYAHNLLPGGDRRPAGVVYPASTADVQRIVHHPARGVADAPAPGHPDLLFSLS
jgi:hypothetical protein